jgi:hypothetical protein
LMRMKAVRPSLFLLCRFDLTKITAVKKPCRLMSPELFTIDHVTTALCFW